MKTNPSLIPVPDSRSPVLPQGIAARLSEGYTRIATRKTELIRSIVEFGVTLASWERYLGAGKCGRNSGGQGLRLWLADNCPEINYNTAMGYKSLAAKACAMLGGGAMAEAALLGRSEVTNPAGDVIEVDDAVVTKRDELFENANSRRKLEQMYFEFTRMKKTVGRPSQGALDYPAVRKSETENAVAILWPMVFPILKHRGAWMKAVTLVPTEKLREASETVGEFLAAIQSELKSR